MDAELGTEPEAPGTPCVLLDPLRRAARCDAVDGRGQTGAARQQHQSRSSRVQLGAVALDAGVRHEVERTKARRSTPSAAAIVSAANSLKTDHIEIAWVRAVAQDFYGDGWLGMFEKARQGAFKALRRLRDEGVITALGLGVNRVEPIELLLELEGPRPDGFLLAGRYALLDHRKALQRVMPKVAEHGLGIVVGGPYSSRVPVGGPNFEYVPATQAILDKVARIKAIADRHGVGVKAAGLQFSLANPDVTAGIPGASRPDRLAEDRAAMSEKMPADFWRAQEGRTGRP